jgi:hypothetical protein
MYTRRNAAYPVRSVFARFPTVNNAEMITLYQEGSTQGAMPTTNGSSTTSTLKFDLQDYNSALLTTLLVVIVAR